MSQLLSQLGIDWHLLISQLVNFGLLLVVLWKFVYKPLLKMLHDRRDKIEQGMVQAEEAHRRLLEAEQMKKDKLKEADVAALAVLKKTEADAKALEAKLIAEVKRKEAEEMKNAEAGIRAREDESRRAMEKEAAALVRQAIVRTVELSPEKIDDALIAKAIKESII